MIQTVQGQRTAKRATRILITVNLDRDAGARCSTELQALAPLTRPEKPAEVVRISVLRMPENRRSFPQASEHRPKKEGRGLGGKRWGDFPVPGPLWPHPAPSSTSISAAGAEQRPRSAEESLPWSGGRSADLTNKLPPRQPYGVDLKAPHKALRGVSPSWKGRLEREENRVKAPQAKPTALGFLERNCCRGPMTMA